MAELSPELAAKIQSLEGGYADNPGRYFVALAGAWREAGETGRAEEILRENLKRFPGLSAHVLLGRCLADRGAYQEAANEFHYVLSIDAQNLIALRTLAEMAAASGHRTEAERWYHELLAVDPMNAEARVALADLSRAGADASVADQPVQVGTGWGGAAEQAPVAGGADAEGADEFGMIDLSAPDASAADASGAAADDDAGGEWGDLPLDVPAEPEPASAAPTGSFDAFGFGSVDLDAGAAAGAGEWVDTEARQDLGESAAADPLSALDDTLLDAPIAGADLPFLDADATVPADLPEGGAGHRAPDFPSFDAPGLVDEGFPAFAAAPADDAAALPAFAADDQAEHHDHVDAEVVTETMAELYAAQGLLQQSADTYRELIRQRGEEPGLVRRLAEIEARMQPAAPEPAPEAEAPDWLASVDAFAMGGAAASLAAIHISAEPEPEPEPAAEPAGGFDFAGPATEPANGFSFDAPAAEPADSFNFAAPAADGSAFTAEPAGTLDETAAEPFASPAVPAGAAWQGDADPFADSFAGGFDGAETETPEPALAAAPAAAEAEGDREPWETPAVRDTEPVGFDLIVVEEDGDVVAAPPEVVADVSADWAIAAAPLEDDEEAAEEGAYAPAAIGGAAASTMRAYFAGLLAWQPGQAAPAAAEVPAVDAAPAPAADEGPAEATAAPAPFAEELPAETAPAPASFAGELPAETAPASAEAEEEPWAESPAPPVTHAEAEPWAEDAAGEAPAYDLPAPTPPRDEPSAADADAAPVPPAGGDDLPLMDLADEPWAAPRTPAPAEIDSFTLADDVAPAPPAPAAEPAPPVEAVEEPLPWSCRSQPVAPAAEAADAGGGFSFEDFFAGSGPSAEPEAPRCAEPAPEPEPVREPEAPPAFIPSQAFEPAAPAPAAPTPPPAPAAPAASAPAGGQDEDDEDLESFQAWLQSLKR